MRASVYERELITYLSRSGIVGRFAASGTINTIVGDLVYFPRRGEGLPWIVEVKSTRRDVYYPSSDYRKLALLCDLSKLFPFRPVLAVRFVGLGWKLVFLDPGIPSRVTPEDAFFVRGPRVTVDEWVRKYGIRNDLQR